MTVSGLCLSTKGIPLSLQFLFSFIVLRLNQLSEEFYTLVDQTEISQKFYIPEEAVDVVSEYWKLKRKVSVLSSEVWWFLSLRMV